jgi:hypothetical protein
MGAGRVFELGAAVEGFVVSSGTLRRMHMTKAIEITVLMTVRDTPARMLQQSIDSILAQTFDAFEFLILDDRSRDAATLACLEQCARRDSRIRLEPSPVEGLPATANVGIARARGEFIARQDADDWSQARRLEVQLEFLRAHPGIGLCGSAAWKHRADGQRLWKTRMPGTAAEIQAAFPKQNPFIHGSTMFRRALALGIGGYREEFRCSLDYDFLWRLSEVAGAANVPEPLYHYRYWGGAVSARRADDQARACRAAQILANSRRRGERENVLVALASGGGTGETLRASLRQADHVLLAGEFGRALEAYAALVRAHPRSGLAWAKLARWGIFASVPAARKACFQ